MGDKWYDWILPLRMSPHLKWKERSDSAYPLGSVFERLKSDAGISWTVRADGLNWGPVGTGMGAGLERGPVETGMGVGSQREGPGD